MISATVEPMRTFLLMILAFFSLHANAADVWPSRPVKLVVPFSAGGVQDLLARSFSNELASVSGQPVIVENRAGAGGTVGTNLVAKSAPDGYTLVVAAASHNINGSLFSKMPYDPLKDFTGAAYLGNTGYVLMTNADFPPKTVAEFIALVKSKPGQFNFASAGNGSASHLAMAYFTGLAGLDMTHIPTKGTGEAINELLAGRSQAVIAANISALPFAKDSRIRFLGVTTEKPSPFVPGVLPINNTLKGYVFDSWFALLAPAATPKEVINKISLDITQLMTRPEIRERFKAQGIEAGTMTPDELNQLLRRNYEQMAQVVKISGAKVD